MMVGPSGTPADTSSHDSATSPDALSAEGEALAPASAHGPKLVFTLGRGTRGKTMFTRWVSDRAMQTGRGILVADADRSCPNLSAYLENVSSPPSASTADMRDWFGAFCEQVIERRMAAIVDFAGGDPLLRRLAREIGLVEFLQAYGVQAVAVHLIGPSRDDLAILRDLEAGRLFAPEATILVLNEGLVPRGYRARGAYADVVTHPIFQAALGRGARAAWMPYLRPALQIEKRRLTFAAAEAGMRKAGQAPISPRHRQTVANWRRSMDDNFRDTAGWLP